MLNFDFLETFLRNICIWLFNIFYISEIFFLKSHTQNVVEKLVPDTFLKIQNEAYLWINSLKFYTACSVICPGGRLPKYI